MLKLLSRLGSYFAARTHVGSDRAGNRYFVRAERIDGVVKEKRWVVFKGEADPTLIPVEWICWLNGQRKKAPTPEDMEHLEAMRECVRENVALLKEEERRAKEEGRYKITSKVGGPDKRSFIRQFPTASEDGEVAAEEPESLKKASSSEPKGSGLSFKPGAWQPPD